MPALIARALPVLFVLGCIWGIYQTVNRARSSPIRLTRVSAMGIIIVVLLAVIAYLVMR